MTTAATTSTADEIVFKSVAPIDRCSLCGNGHERGVYVKNREHVWSFTVCDACVLSLKNASEGGA